MARSRVFFIATPHRGSRVDQGRLGHLGSRLVRLPDPLRASYGRLMARNGPDFFKERFRNGLPTSVYAIAFSERTIWGVTAGILRNLWERIYTT